MVDGVSMVFANSHMREIEYFITRTPITSRAFAYERRQTIWRAYFICWPLIASVLVILLGGVSE